MERYSNNNQNASNSGLGNSLLVLIILTALAGAIYSFAGPNHDAGSLEGNVLPTRINQKPGNASNDDEAVATSIAYKSKQYLEVEGMMEVGMPIQFKINRFNANGQYLIDFGNGENEKIQSAKSSYTYTEAGRYTVKLKLKYNGSIQTLHTETLYIEDAMELAIN